MELTLSELLGVCDCDSLLLGVRVGVCESLTVADDDSETLGVGLNDSLEVGVRVILGLAVRVVEGVMVAEAVVEIEGVLDGLIPTESELVGVPLVDGDCDVVEDGVWLLVGVWVGVFESLTVGVGVVEADAVVDAVLLGVLVGVFELLTVGVAVALAVFVVDELGVPLLVELGVLLGVLLALTVVDGVLENDVLGVLEKDVLGVGVDELLGVVLGVGVAEGLGETQTTLMQAPHEHVPEQSGSPRGSGHPRPSRGSKSLRKPSTLSHESTVHALLSLYERVGPATHVPPGQSITSPVHISPSRSQWWIPPTSDV